MQKPLVEESQRSTVASRATLLELAWSASGGASSVGVVVERVLSDLTTGRRKLCGTFRETPVDDIVEQVLRGS